MRDWPDFDGREPGQWQEAAESVLADGEGHGAKGPDGGQAHDDADDAEHAAKARIEKIDERAGGIAKLCERETEAGLQRG